jgi:hypothetical protein
VGFECEQCNDAYAAVVAITGAPLAYAALVLCLQSFYREELNLIRTCKQRYPHLTIWLTQTEGRQATVAEALQLGADGLLDQEGLHPHLAGARSAGYAATAAPASDDLPPHEAHSLDRGDVHAGATETESSGNGQQAPQSDPVTRHDFDQDAPGVVMEPILTAEELRALLQEQPSNSTGGGRDEGA